MITTKNLMTCLRYLSAATIFAVGCTAATGEETTDPTAEDQQEEAVATTEEALSSPWGDSDKDGVKNRFDVCPRTDTDRHDGRDFDHDGFDKDGFDRDGYDRDGYDWDGYDHDGWDRDHRDHRDNDVSRRGCSCEQVKKIVSGKLDIEKFSHVRIKADACPTENKWGKPVCYKNHGKYVSCVDKILDELRDKKIADKDCAERILKRAAKSDIGKKGEKTHCDRRDHDDKDDHDYDGRW